MLYCIWMYQQINNPIILTFFIVLQLYESLNFRHTSNYIILWPPMTLTFTQRPWTYFHVVADPISFNLSVIWCHMLILHDAISIFISPTPNFLSDFALEQFWQNCKYLPYCRVWECLSLLKMCPRWSFMKIKWVILWPFYGCKHPLAPGL